MSRANFPPLEQDHRVRSQGGWPTTKRIQPTLEERDAAVGAVEAILLVEAKKARGRSRCRFAAPASNSEYDLSIRDLTGVTIPATKEFPVDRPAAKDSINTAKCSR